MVGILVRNEDPSDVLWVDEGKGIFEPVALVPPRASGR
jgi:hypothetical protein